MLRLRVVFTLHTVVMTGLMMLARTINAEVLGLAANNNESRDTQQAQAMPLLIQVEGQPGLLNEFEYAVLEDTFVEAYNSLTERLCPDAAPRTITVYMERDVSNYASPGDGTVSRLYTLKGQATIPKEFPLFSSSQGVAVRRNLNKSKIDKKPRRLSRSGKGGKGGTTSGYVKPEESEAAVTTPDAIRKSCPGLTEQAFTLAFREGVRSKSDQLGTSVTDVANVAELTPTVCDEANLEFSTDVVVTFTGDPSLWSLPQQAALAQSFAQTYRSLNGLNPETCDLLFRDVSNVTIYREQEFRRRLKESFSYLYRITGTCRGCQRDSRLFAQGVSGRALLSDKVPSLSDDTNRRLQNDTCSCPVNATQPRAPTEEEFQIAYENTISILQQENVIDAGLIESVVNVNEVQQVTEGCAPVETFETLIDVELFGTASAVTAAEIEALELGFTQTYAQLSGSFCDPFFRTPIDVVIDTMTGVGRRLQSGSSIKYQYQVTGTCRGCGKRQTPFWTNCGKNAYF